MADTLFAWIGRTDLEASNATVAAGLGPIAHAVEARTFEHVVLISDWPDSDTARYLAWLRARTQVDIEIIRRVLPNGPMDFGTIYQVAKEVVSGALGGRRALHPVFHMSPGTPAMAAVWILLAKTIYDAELIESSKVGGVRVADIPFDIAAEFIPAVLRKRDAAVEKAVRAPPPEAPEFAQIIHRSTTMARLLAMAQRIAPR